MCYLFIIPVHKTDLIFFIEGLNLNSRFIVQVEYKIGILNYHHPFVLTMIN